MSFLSPCELSSSCWLYVQRKMICTEYQENRGGKRTAAPASRFQACCSHRFQFPLQHRTSSRVVDYFTSATSAALLPSWSCPWVVACPLFAPSSHRLEVDLAFCSRRRDSNIRSLFKYSRRTQVNPYICCILVRTEMGKKQA